MKEDKPPSQVAPRVNVRFPEGMREQLHELARENERSVNAEILARLKQSLERDMPPHACVQEGDTPKYHHQDDIDTKLHKMIKELSFAKKKALIDLLTK